jgi:hypothetical protein
MKTQSHLTQICSSWKTWIASEFRLVNISSKNSGLWTSSFIPHFEDSSSYSDHPYPKGIIILSTFQCHFPNTLRATKLDCILWNTRSESHKDDEILHFLKITLKYLVPNTYVRSLPRTKAAAYKHSWKFNLTESWHKSNIVFSQYNIMYCHCHESMSE